MPQNRSQRRIDRADRNAAEATRHRQRMEAIQRESLPRPNNRPPMRGEITPNTPRRRP